jgi:hypothetical protein
VTERACANDTEAILFPKVVNFDDSAHLRKVEIGKLKVEILFSTSLPCGG